MAVVVQKSGMLTTIQDCGRYGSQGYGVCVSGAMDKRACRIANILVGNPQQAAVLEATLMGPTLLFEETCVIAITGGDLSPQRGGRPVPMYQAVQMNAGDELSFIAPKSGCRAYIAFSGELDIQPVFGSYATHVPSGMGSLNGGKLEAGDRLPLKGAGLSGQNLSRYNAPVEYFTQTELEIRVVLGPQDDHFTAKGLNAFISSPYQLTNECNRTGLRLSGEQIEHMVDGNIISDAIACGSIQVPTNGQPIILMADCQTVGGYTKIATVITADQPLLAQAKPGTKVRFRKVGIRQAQDIYIALEKELTQLEHRINGT